MTYLIKTALAVALTAALSTSAHAQDSVCETGDARVIPEFEEAKDKFLRANFVGFQQFMAQSLGQSAEALKGPLQQISSLVPDGFSSCRVIAQRIDAGGTVQEITAFELENSQIPLSVYLLGVPTKDGLSVLYVGFDGSPHKVLGYFK
jgi:hypothetical protein